jgi:dTDP-4-amino-4,6-dideoxygalactose transaminase
MAIDIFNPFIRRKDMDSVLSCMVTDKIGPGDRNKELVEKGCEFFSAQNGYAFRDPARAFEVLLRGEFDESGAVFLSPLAPDYYRAGAENAGCELVYMDVDGETGCIDYKIFDEIDKSGYENYLVVADSPAGNVVDLAEFIENGITVVEDVTSVAGLESDDYKPGSVADYIFLSLENDSLVTASGGALLLGREKKHIGKLNKSAALFKDYVFLTDLNSSLAITQLEQLKNKIAKRKTVFSFLVDAAGKSIHHMMKKSHLTEAYVYSFPMLIDTGMNDVLKYTKKREIETRSCFAESIMSSSSNPADFNTPNALSLFMRCLLFPLHGSIGKSDCEYLSRVITTLP